MITDALRRKVALFIKEIVDDANVGSGGNSTSPSANDLDVPLLSSNVSVTTSESSENTMEIKVTIPGSSITGRSIREIGFFGAVPADDQFDEMVGTSTSSYTTETIMLARHNFEAIGPFSSTDSIEFSFIVEVD